MDKRARGHAKEAGRYIVLALSCAGLALGVLLILAATLPGRTPTWYGVPASAQGHDPAHNTKACPIDAAHLCGLLNVQGECSLPPDAVGPGCTMPCDAALGMLEQLGDKAWPNTDMNLPGQACEMADALHVYSATVATERPNADIAPAVGDDGSAGVEHFYRHLAACIYAKYSC